MDRERQEPTFSTPDLTEVHFGSSRIRETARRTDGPPWGYIAAGVAVAILIAMGLIEWNARRQAAAITAELTRPMTKVEQAKFDAEMARQAKEDEANIRELRRYMEKPITVMPAQQHVEPTSLRDGQRCIGGKRLERIPGGWRDLPHEPC
ncbi:hypothetical protein K4043_01670 [Stenotrophomonas sp. SRS1]|uniref:hypothetical protein n=1 Tax=Stenotrophomonas sp. SRS1 TaxID=2870345 RepID=UPI002238C40A|nr:hypothetical protein [Stenotrophomonas sp. SRS1]MCW6026717.1 hypothetical protein [Stenotrophomonas sp. SRS1]